MAAHSASVAQESPGGSTEAERLYGLGLVSREHPTACERERTAVREREHDKVMGCEIC